MNKPHAICIMLILLAGSATFGWFKEGHIIYFWDATYPLNPTKAIIDYFYTWSESAGLGETDIIRVKMIPYLFFIFLTYNSFGLLFSQMLLYFFLFSFSGIGMFILTYHLLKKGNECKVPILLILVGSTSSALFYMFNLYSMLFLWRIFSTSLFLYSALPFIFLFFVRLVERTPLDRKNLSLLAFLFFIASVSHPSLIILLLVFLSLYLLYSIVFCGKKGKIKIFPIMFIAFLLINAYWLLPLAYHSTHMQGIMLSDPYGGTLSALYFNSRFSSLLSIFRLKGQQILYEQYQGEYDYPWITIYHDEKINFFTLVPFLIPLFCFFPLLFRKKNYLFFGSVSLLLMFFVKGTHDPLGIFYEYLFNTIPIFSTFRDPYSKFGLFYTFCMSFLFGAGITEICFSLRKIVKKLRLNIIIPLIIVILLVGPYMFPMWTGDVIFKGSNVRPSAVVEIPEEYADIVGYLEKEAKQSSFKIIELPFQDRPLQSCLWNNGYVGYPAIRTLTYLPTISGITGNEKINEFYRSLYKSFEINPSSIIPLLGRLNIKYVILHEDINLRFAPPTTNPDKLKALLENSNGLVFVKQFGKLRLWQLQKFYPTIYAILNKDQSNITYFSFEEESIPLEFLSSETKEAFSAKIDNVIKYQGNYSLKITTNTAKNGWWSWVTSKEIHVRENGLYQVITHVKANNVVQSHIAIEGFNETSMSWQQILQNPNGLDGTFEWREFSKFLAIPQNITKIRFIFNSGWAKDTTKGNATTWFDDIMITQILGDEEILTLGYRKINPTLWKVELNTQKPFILSFTECYDPLWACYVNGERIPSKPLYGFVNGFWINQTGQLEIVIEYEPQKWFYIGSAISIATLTACIAYLTYSYTKNKNILQKLKHLLAGNQK